MKNHRQLEHSDVVFMLPAEDFAAYRDYGATVVAWGGAHTLAKVKEMDEAGIHATGTMWCLTAGAKELHEDPDVREATVRDIAGEPIAVPWIWDLTYEGTPSWFSCGNHPSYRAFMRKKVCEAMAGGAFGLHVDDHLNTAAPAISYGGCFCDYCMKGFAKFLAKHETPALLAEAGVDSFADFDYRTLVRQYAVTREAYLEKQLQIPLHSAYIDFQLQHAAENVRQLKQLASEIVERPISLSANTCLPKVEHTVVTPYTDYLVGEVEQHAPEGTRRLMNAVKAYRMAEAVGRPMAATAHGMDWAFAKAHKRNQLVCTWVALCYACGQRLMTPHHAWCFTEELGTHWFDGDTHVFAPLYRFIRANRELFDDACTVGPLVAPRNVPETFETEEKRNRLAAALDQGNPQPLMPASEVWAFPRAKEDGAGIIHLINLDYNAKTDWHALKLDTAMTFTHELFGRTFTKAEYFRYDAEPVQLQLQEDALGFTLRIPELRVWGIIRLS